MPNKRTCIIVANGSRPAQHVPDLDDASRQQLRVEAEPLLTPRQFQIFCRRYGLDGEPPQKLTTIATELGLSVDTVEGHLQSARIRFARWYEPVPPRERVRRDLLLGQPISADFIGFHAQIDAEQLYAAHPDLAVETLMGDLPPVEHLYPAAPHPTRDLSRDIAGRVSGAAPGASGDERVIAQRIDSILNGIALIIAAWAILGSFAAWRWARRRRTWGQWGHLAMLLVYVALTAYLIISFGSVIIAAHS